MPPEVSVEQEVTVVTIPEQQEFKTRAMQEWEAAQARRHPTMQKLVRGLSTVRDLLVEMHPTNLLNKAFSRRGH